jgi:hypothetical protein
MLMPCRVVHRAGRIRVGRIRVGHHVRACAAVSQFEGGRGEGCDAHGRDAEAGREGLILKKTTVRTETVRRPATEEEARETQLRGSGKALPRTLLPFPLSAAGLATEGGRSRERYTSKIY